MEAATAAAATFGSSACSPISLAGDESGSGARATTSRGTARGESEADDEGTHGEGEEAMMVDDEEAPYDDNGARLGDDTTAHTAASPAAHSTGPAVAPQVQFDRSEGAIAYHMSTVSYIIDHSRHLLLHMLCPSFDARHKVTC